MSGEISEFIGVYDADSTLLGELSYWIGARFGKRHCSLCEITHGVFTERTDWKRIRQGILVPFVTFHRNDAPSDVLAVVGGEFPCVVARHAGEVAVALGAEELESLDGSPESLVSRLNQLVSSAGDDQSR